jgi:RND family efflux transporter MFP subunit
MCKGISVLFAVSVSICAIFAVTGCNTSPGGGDARAAAVPSARVAIAQRGNISHVLTLAGQFQPYQVVDVHPKVSGYMKKINVDIGDIVHEGQTLAVLEVPELKAQLRQTVFAVGQSQEEITRTQHDVNRAVATHAALHSAYERLEEAAKSHPGLIAQQELDDAQAKDLASEAQVDAAKAAMAGAKQRAGEAQADNQRVQAMHDYTTVQAPISGVVVWRYADTGALIQGGTNSNSQDLPIVRLSQSTLLRLRIPVPESDIRYVHNGDELEVRVDAVGRSFTGKIVRFTRDINFETRTMETEVDLQNRDLQISPGMYANTMLRLGRAENVVTVPIEALVLNGRQRVVYVVDSSNRVHQCPVEAGIQGSKLAEIRKGLQPGDRVIIGGQEKYEENEEIIPEVQQTQANETVQETGGMIDLRGEDNIASQVGPESASEQQAGQSGVENHQPKPATPAVRDTRQSPGGPQ